MDWILKEELEGELKMSLSSPLFLVTYHPVTLEGKDPAELMQQLLYALESFSEANIVFTYPNSDTGGRVLIELIDSFVAKNQSRCKAFVSLGQRKYLSLMRISDIILGNSSSGITEAPALKKATVNIGDRQKGRLKAKTILDCMEEKNSIVNTINQCLSSEFQSSLNTSNSLYGYGNVSKKIKEQIKSFDLRIRKTFFDLEFNY